jgi:hypothetical protein
MDYFSKINEKNKGKWQKMMPFLEDEGLNILISPIFREK